MKKKEKVKIKKKDITIKYIKWYMFIGLNIFYSFEELQIVITNKSIQQYQASINQIENIF